MMPSKPAFQAPTVRPLLPSQALPARLRFATSFVCGSSMSPTFRISASQRASHTLLATPGAAPHVTPPTVSFALRFISLTLSCWEAVRENARHRECIPHTGARSLFDELQDKSKIHVKYLRRHCLSTPTMRHHIK